MPDKDVSQVAPPQEPQERVPVFQQIVDNPFLLLFLGVVMPTVLYILWGVMEIAGIPVTPLATGVVGAAGGQ